MAKKTTKRKKKPFDIMTDLIVIAVFLILAVVIGSMLLNNLKDKKKSSDAAPKATQEAVETQEPKQEGVSVYTCVISTGEELGETEFELEFNSNDMTYIENLKAGTQESILDQGKYTEKDGKIKTVSTKTKGNKASYFLDGNYILVEEQLYKGTVPKDAGKTFHGKFTYDINNMGQTTIRFNKDGTYILKTVSFGDKKSSEKDSTVTEKGTYEKEGNWISRTTDAGEEKLNYYIYEGQITNAYYKKVE